MGVTGRPWWQGAVGYEVYLRSFQDSDGDGIGDLGGLRRRLDYLANLGVDLVWVTPLYPTPDADHGYDVADYLAVDERFGDLDAVRHLLAEAHGLGLRVIFDLVPNHTSDRHAWFQAAGADRNSPYRDYYVWRDPAPGGGPPNNWVSNFGGPAWTWHPSGQYYLHLFLPEQPDLNWAHPPVRDEFDQILGFWFDLGVDGFRIDVAHSLVKDPELRDNPRLREVAADAHPRVVHRSFNHLHDLDQPGVVDIYRRWRGIATAYDALLVGEVYLLDPQRLTRYVAPQDGLHSAFCFPALQTGWDADEIRDALVRGTAAGAGHLAWPLSSHDDPHAAMRFGGGATGARRALAYLTLLSGLPAMTFLHQGDELGIEDGEVSPADATDPIAVRTGRHLGRDGSRTPMPWDTTEHAGFTTGAPWLPLGANRSERDTVAWQEGRSGSHLEQVRTLLQVRRTRPDLLGDADVVWLDHGGPVIAYQRGATVVACNLSGEPADVPVAIRAQFVSRPDPAPLPEPTRTLPGDTAVIGDVAG